jgi:hypothetical protein
MLHHRRFSISPILFILIALALTLAFSCSDQPTAIDKDSGSGLNGDGKIDPGASGSFLLGEVSDTSLGSGTIEVWAMNVAFNETTGIASFDVQLLNRTQRTHYLPIRFVITDIRPDDIAVVDFDGTTEDALPFYTFSERLGGGNALDPGARTEPVTMKFHTVTARSFAIGFRLVIGPAAGTGAITGVVFLDSDEDGERDRACRCEPGIPGITVALEKTLDSGDMVTLIAGTDSSGEYRFAGLREGVYKVFVVAPRNAWKVTSANPLLVTLVKGADGKVQSFLGAHFGLYPLFPPAEKELFGPLMLGPMSPFGTELDSTFVNPPSQLTVIFNYYVDVTVPPYMMPIAGVVDSAVAWINGEKVFEYARTMPPDSGFPATTPPDSASFPQQTIKLPEGLVQEGENTIRLVTTGDRHAALMWRVYKKP